MPWRFVQMYGRMQFSDVVVAHALSENNRCLRIVGAGRDSLSSASIGNLVAATHRLESCWELLRFCVTEPVFQEAMDRLAQANNCLAPAADEVCARHELTRLADRSGKEKSRSAMLHVIDALDESPVAPVGLERLSVAFEADSRQWRELPLTGFDENAILDGFERCYESGRDYGARALAGSGEPAFTQWSRWARATFHQLDLMRPALSPDNRARRWCLGRINDGFDKQRGLISVRTRLGRLALPIKDRIRIEALIETGLEECRCRVMKLFAHAYGPTPRAFRDGVWLDANRLAYDGAAVWPRSA